jgi:hypothetical protein
MSIFKRYCKQRKNVDDVACARVGNRKSGKTGGKEVSINISCTRTQATSATNEQDRAPFVDNSTQKPSTVSTNGLPARCSLITGVVPAGCRFHPTFFNRMITEGVLARSAGCPVYDACSLVVDG